MSALERQLEAIRAAPRGSRVGAFFDFDGTLIDGYSAAAYFSSRLRRREVGLRELGKMFKLWRSGEPTESEFGRIMAEGVADWAGMAESELADMWRDLFKRSVAGWMFPEGYRLVQAHLQAGHTVAIASSATRYQIQPLAEEYGIEHVLSTQVGIKRGVVNGKVVGTVPWGSGKAAVVGRFAKSEGIDLRRSFGYANGNEDLQFLDSLGKPVAVNPKPELEAHAEGHDWPRLAFAVRRRPPLSAIAGTAGVYAAWAGAFGLGYALEKATGDKRRAVNLIGSVGSELGLAAAGVEMEVHGEQNLWAERPAVFILNHQSKLEFFLFPKLVRRDLSGVAKKEAAKVPGFGHFMRMSDFAFLDRENTESAVEALKAAVERLRSGLSIAMAPEGTRSYSPRVGSFKKGAFHMAMQAGVPVVPVVFRNTAELMPRDAQLIRPGTVQVSVLPPIQVSSWKMNELDARIAEVRQQFVDTLENWPGEANGSGSRHADRSSVGSLKARKTPAKRRSKGENA